VRPFSEPELQRATDVIEKQRMKDFNYNLSKQRITVEHAFGALKGRFRALRHLGAHRDEQDNWQVIEALLILHNMCLFYSDHPETFAQLPKFHESPSSLAAMAEVDLTEEILNNPPVSMVDGPTNLPQYETDTWLKEQGQVVRRRLLDELFPVEDYMYI